MLQLNQVSGFYRKVGAMSLSRYMSIGSALLVTIVLTRLLDEEVYGAYRKLWLIYAILGPVFISSIANTLFYRGKGESRDEAILANMTIGLLYGLLTGAVAWLFSPFWATQLNVQDLQAGFALFAPYMAFSVYAGIAEPLFVTINRKKWLISYSIAYNTFEAALIVVPFALGLPIEQVVIIMAIGPALRSLFLTALAFKNLSNGITLSRVFREIPVSLKYGFGLILLSIAGISATEVDKWVIGSFFESDALFAIYVIGAKKIPFIIALTSSVSAALVNEYVNEVRDGNFEGILREIKKVTARLSLIIIPVIASLFIYAEEVLTILFGQTYSASAPILRIYMLTVLSQLFFPQSVSLASGKSGVNAFAGFTELAVNIVLSIILVMTLGLIGPALATLVGHFLFTLILMAYCFKAFGIKPTSFLPDARVRSLWWSLGGVLLTGLVFKHIILWNWTGLVITGIVCALLVMLSLRKFR